MYQEKIQIIIPTLDAIDNTRHFLENLEKIISSGFDVLVVDSSSSDGTASEAKRVGAEVLVIPRADFNHGATRESVRKKNSKDIVIFLTQDVVIISSSFIEFLVKPLIESKEIAVSYARQIPHENADIFEAFPRVFNYPEKSEIRSLADVDKYGIYTFFCSNSCSAYRNEQLDEIGGFDPLMNSEEYFAVVKLLNKGYKIAYVAEAVVKHSHRYSLSEGFKRYFDIGYVRALFPEVNQKVGRAEPRGWMYAKKLMAELVKRKQFHLIPFATLQFATMWFGFRTGYYSHWLPTEVKKRLSAQPEFWTSKYFS